jgi:hypothetical protein
VSWTPTGRCWTACFFEANKDRKGVHVRSCYAYCIGQEHASLPNAQSRNGFQASRHKRQAEVGASGTAYLLSGLINEEKCDIGRIPDTLSLCLAVNLIIT